MEDENYVSAQKKFKELSERFRPEPVKPSEIKSLLSTNTVLVVDEFDNLIEELFKIDNPSINPDDEGVYSAAFNNYRKQYVKRSRGNWFYYPWHNSLVHILKQEDHYRLRSARNKNIIYDSEQLKLQKAKVGIAGLSVGSSAVSAMAMMGIGNLKIADSDTLDLSNLNRIRSGVHSLGLPKTIITARNIFDLDPYINVDVFADGLAASNVEQFIGDLDVLIDEIDDVSIKIKLRLIAREKKIPVLMATDNGDNVLIDIERYDLDNTVEIFHGLLTKDEVKRVQEGNLSKQEWLMYAMKLIDMRHAPLRLLQSVPLIGKELAGVPQIGSTAMFAGAVLAYTTRLILNGEPARHGKFHINIEAILREDYSEIAKKQKKLLKDMMEITKP